MSDENETALAAEDQAYFDSRGETTEKPEPDKVEAVEAEEKEIEEAEASADDEGGDEPEQKQPQVPLRALKKEREEARELKARLAEVEKTNAVLSDRWNTILKVQEQQPEQVVDQDPEPDPNEDLFAHQAWVSRQIKARNEADVKAKQEQEQKTQAEQAERAVWDYWQSDAQTFAKETPDFGEAAKWLSDFRDKQLKSLSVADSRFSDVRARNWQIEQELKQIVIGAAQQQKSPAQLVYEIAKGYGYTKAAPADADKIDEIEKATSGSISLSSVGGEKPSSSIDAKNIANMSEKEFEAWLAKKGEAGFRKAAGG